MKKLFLGLMTLISVLTLAHAEESHHSELATHSGVYFEPKVIITLGDTVTHGGNELEGDTGYGLGFDLGYSFNEYFALELDGTYSVADVTEGVVTDQADFYSYGLNAVGTYPLSHHFILVGKVGYGAEHEDLGEHGITGTEHGATWAVGVEYSFSKHVEVSLEYEGADIESVRGNSVQVGLIYKL